MNKIIYLTLLLSCFSSFAQITGKITDTNKKPLSFVSVYLDKSITGTTSNDSGNYELTIKKTGKYIIVFQFLGYKTVKKNIFEALKDYQNRIQVTLVPNITNICYGRGVGYKIEEIILDEKTQQISATKIRERMRKEGKLK